MKHEAFTAPMNQDEKNPRNLGDYIDERVTEIREIPGLPKNFFNVAAFAIGQELGSPTLLLGRHIEKESGPGEPDIGSLAVAVLNNGVAESFTEVWRPEEGRSGDLLEDPRAVMLPDGRVLIGFTRLAPHEGRYLPFPAVSITTPEALLRGDFPDTHFVTGLGIGDQTTPIGDGSDMFHILPGKNAVPLRTNHSMFRREVDDHRFVVFSHDESGVAKGLQYLEFPKENIPSWGESRMGLTMPPTWLNDNEAILLVHGFNKPNGKFRYHIGAARLFVNENGEYAIDNISQEPLLTPDSFENVFHGEQVERHPEVRDALYLCGGVPIYDAFGNLRSIDSFPSVGDTWTLKASFSAPKITMDWQRDEPLNQTQIAAA